MKKILTLFAAMAMTLTAMATDYTGQLTVTVMGQSMNPQETTITVTEQQDGTYTLLLKNFELTGMMSVGTIELTGVKGEENNGATTLTADQTVTIQSGDDASKQWALAGQSVPVKLNGTMTNKNLEADMTITYALSALFSMDISVSFTGTAASSSIKVAPKVTTNNAATTIYDASGRKLNGMTRGLNIVRKADGTSVKVMKK